MVDAKEVYDRFLDDYIDYKKTDKWNRIRDRPSHPGVFDLSLRDLDGVRIYWLVCFQISRINICWSGKRIVVQNNNPFGMDSEFIIRGSDIALVEARLKGII